VQKAGISTTGAKIENELIPLEKEYEEYRKSKNLWQSKKQNYIYSIEDNKIVRISDREEIAL